MVALERREGSKLKSSTRLSVTMVIVFLRRGCSTVYVDLYVVLERVAAQDGVVRSGDGNSS
jgi:hypothetical protein